MLLLKGKRAVLILAVTSLISGCADYLNHRDTITFGLGNAVEANKGIHTQDPFPRVAQNTHITTDGKTISKIMRGYNGSGPSAGAAMPTAVILPTATPPMGTNGNSSAGN